MMKPTKMVRRITIETGWTERLANPSIYNRAKSLTPDVADELGLSNKFAWYVEESEASIPGRREQYLTPNVRGNIKITVVSAIGPDE